MNKQISIIQWALTAVYIFSNLSKIRGAFRSSVWTKDIDLINHVTNYNVHLQVISILFVLISALLVIAYIKKIKLSSFILVPIVIIAFVLYINTQVDLIRWLEINVFGAGGLILLALALILNLGLRLWKRPSTD